ncbi:MAG: polysaccharide biosynthesis protein [Gemmatimonadaceae bacterium]|nr:polysaccharide biosynthesis protein [Gemmatimonadaceae bacterium]
MKSPFRYLIVSPMAASPTQSAMRNRHFLILDILGLAVVPAVVLLLRFERLDWPPGYAQTMLIYAALTLPARVWIAWQQGMYRTLWQHASVVELERVLGAGVKIAGLNFLVGFGLLQWGGIAPFRMPASALVLDALLSIAVLAAPRFAVRFATASRRRSRDGRRTIVVGAGAAGQLIARESMTSDRAMHQVVAYVDDDDSKLGQFLSGVRVEGRIDDLPRLIRDLGAKDVIIAMPSARGPLIRRIVEMVALAGASARIVPSLSDIVSGRVEMASLRPVEIQDLLRRAPIITDLNAVGTLSASRTVMVTGAGGSIGSELCRQIAALEPELLVLLDHSENQVFEIEGELRVLHPTRRLAPVIADIRDAARVRQVFERYRPFAVFHAAAHKHVPLMEENIVEAITNNVLGTRNVVDAAIDTGVQHFVLISTDKAVRPTSIMGATKRIAEIVVRLAAAKEERHFVAVRFGNVLGSRGSVVPTFLRQIQAGGPVTVTHPEMRRYFMTIPEAVQLVLQAGALGAGGELFVLDMGEPVKIADLARDLIRLSGLEEGVDVEIKYTGMRPGEKLYEEVLFGDEDVGETSHPKVIRVLADEPDPGLESRIADLIRMAQSVPTDDAKLRAALIALVPDFVASVRAPDVLPIRRRSGDHGLGSS